MTHKKAVVNFMPGCKCVKTSGSEFSVIAPGGENLAMGVTPQQAWYCARIVLGNRQFPKQATTDNSSSTNRTHRAER